jgi:hypothetical protein
MNTPHGPDRATYKHWLDREPKPVQGAAAVLRAFRRKLGAPNGGIHREPDGRHVYVWLNGFDLHSITIFPRHNPTFAL